MGLYIHVKRRLYPTLIAQRMYCWCRDTFITVVYLNVIRIYSFPPVLLSQSKAFTKHCECSILLVIRDTVAVHYKSRKRPVLESVNRVRRSILINER